MDREAFLNRLAAGLGRERKLSKPERVLIGVPAFYREQPFGPGEPPDLAERFKLELESVGGEVILVDTLAEVAAALRVVIARFHAQRIVSWSREELAGWALDWLWSARARAFLDPGLESEEQLRAELLSADIGITSVDFAIANTGTLVVSAARGRPRSVSLLPTLHMALVKKSQLVSRMGEVLNRHESQANEELPSALHFITGPSRTSDIENDLTIGVHGPAAVTAIVWRQA